MVQNPLIRKVGERLTCLIDTSLVNQLTQINVFLAHEPLTKSWCKHPSGSVGHSSESRWHFFFLRFGSRWLGNGRLCAFTKSLISGHLRQTRGISYRAHEF